jgi:hypothetical protein
VSYSDWAANDGFRTFTLLEVADPALLERIEAPFRPYVEMDGADAGDAGDRLAGTLIRERWRPRRQCPPEKQKQSHFKKKPRVPRLGVYASCRRWVRAY